jgi:hypothetical protein
MYVYFTIKMTKSWFIGQLKSVNKLRIPQTHLMYSSRFEGFLTSEDTNFDFEIGERRLRGTN